MNKKGYVSLEKYFVDGTKIESPATKYTFIWKKAIEKNEKKIDEKLKVFLKEVESKNNEKLAEINHLDDEESKDVKKKLKKAQRQIEKDFLPRKEKMNQGVNRQQKYINVKTITTKKKYKKKGVFSEVVKTSKTTLFIYLEIFSQFLQFQF